MLLSQLCICSDRPQCVFTVAIHLSCGFILGQCYCVYACAENKPERREREREREREKRERERERGNLRVNQ